MFCKNCGNQLPDNTPFCSSCGMQQSDNLVTARTGGVAVASERELVLHNMENSFSVMTAIKEKEIQIASYEETIAHEQKEARMLQTIGFFAIGYFICIFIGAFSDSGEVFTTLGVIIFVAFGILGIVNRIHHKKKAAKFIEKKGICDQELEMLKNDAVLSWLPYDYRDSTSFAYLFSYLNNMRASNLKEAINLYETEKHQARLEMISAITANAATDAANAANSAARSAAASAFFSLFK
ncbi:MAG: zinc ribbon domain-containing protein [Oscillospiraceae bacterium]|nr:zinc ribbon domain-containing protein [Oscillospiraceae bacterium]